MKIVEDPIKNKSILVKTVWTGAKALIKEASYDLLDVNYVKDNNAWYLRFVIDSARGIIIDDCEKVSNILSPWLDSLEEKGFVKIPDPYSLEVESPGIRPLQTWDDFFRYVGHCLEISFYSKTLGMKKILAYLEGVDQVGNKLYLQYIVNPECLAALKAAGRSFDFKPHLSTLTDEKMKGLVSEAEYMDTEQLEAEKLNNKTYKLQQGQRLTLTLDKISKVVKYFDF